MNFANPPPLLIFTNIWQDCKETNLGDAVLTVVINGNQRELAEGTAVVDLIAFLDLRPDRVAVEVNGRIVKRAEWAGTALNDGDRIEVVQFVGGGSYH